MCLKHKLKDSGLGFHVGRSFAVAFPYADDLDYIVLGNVDTNLNILLDNNSIN